MTNRIPASSNNQQVKQLTEACARVLGLPLFVDGDFVHGYVWVDETESDYGYLEQINHDEDGFRLDSLYFAPLTRIADAMRLAAKLNGMTMMYGFADAHVQYGDRIESVPYQYTTIPAYKHTAMCEAICKVAVRIC